MRTYTSGFILFLLAVFQLSCRHNKEDKNNVVFFNDFENIRMWTNEPYTAATIVKTNSYSGNYCLVIKPENTYSFAFNYPIAHVGIKSIRSISCEAVFNMGDINTLAMIVAKIESPKKEYYYKTVQINSMVNKPLNWLTCKLDIPFDSIKTPIDPEATLAFYIWNKDGANFKCDDMKVTFFKR